MSKEKFEELEQQYWIRLNKLKTIYYELLGEAQEFEDLIYDTNRQYFEYVKSTIDPSLIFDDVDKHKIRIVKRDEIVPIIYDKYLTKFEFKIHETHNDVVIGKYEYFSNELTHELLPRNFSESKFDWNISDGLKALFEGDRN